MANLSRLKKQAPIRLFPEDYEKIKAKLVKDSLTFQKLGELLFKAYLRGNKEIEKLVKKHSDEKNNRKRRYTFTELEADDILSFIENESPLALKKLSDEVDKEIKNK